MHQGKACYLAALSKSEDYESTTQHFNLDTKEYTMPKSTFIPAGDHDFLIWMEHFIANLTPATGATESEIAALKAARADFRAKIIHTNDAAAPASSLNEVKRNRGIRFGSSSTPLHYIEATC
jgi:hypothetical protein